MMLLLRSIGVAVVALAVAFSVAGDSGVDNVVFAGRIVFVEPKDAEYLARYSASFGGSVRQHFLVLDVEECMGEEDLPTRILLSVDVHPLRADLCDMNSGLLRLDRWAPGDNIVVRAIPDGQPEFLHCFVPAVLGVVNGKKIREHPALEPYLDLPLYCTNLGQIIYVGREDGAEPGVEP